MKPITPRMHAKMKSFWRYWEANKANIQVALSTFENTEVLYALIKKLQGISRRIYYSLESNKISGNIKITITAEGNRKLFPKVYALTEKFPMITGFTVQALIQPTEDLEKYKLGTDDPQFCSDFTLKISEMKFQILNYNTDYKKLKIRVLLPNYRYHFENPILLSNVLTMIECLLGEIAYKKYVQVSDLAQLIDNIQNGIPLYELPEYIDRLKNIKLGNGRIV